MKAKFIFNFSGWLFLCASVISFFYYWDITRIHLVGLKSKNSFAFKELPESFNNYDATQELRISSQTSLKQKRHDLRRVLLGAQDLSKISPFSDVSLYSKASKYISADCNLFHPSANLTICEISNYAKWDNLANLRELTFNMVPGYAAKVYVLRPEHSNNNLILYHHGYSGTFHDQNVILKRLLDQGYTVAAFNMTGYGDNALNRPNLWIEGINGHFDAIKNPLRVFFEPVIGTLNFLTTKIQYTQISMMGLSAGGWITAVSAALDPRIQKSYPVAGLLPISLRHGKKEQAAPQYYPAMLKIASYVDMFVMASDQRERSQLQIFNRFDRCCYNNVRGKLYESAVKENVMRINGGRFDVLIDETHARHKISSWAFDHIMTDLIRKPSS